MPSALQIIPEPESYDSSDKACRESLSTIVAHVHDGYTQHELQVQFFQFLTRLFAMPACSLSARQMQCSQELAAVVFHVPSEHELSPYVCEPNSAVHQ